MESGGDTRTCPSCGQLSQASATWCEACGHELGVEPNPACVSCGEPAVEGDGYCHSCGHRQPEPRDHVELADGSIVAVSDRGQRHHHNEDAVAVATTDDGTVILVVCDGVSSTPGSAEISAVAATAAAEALAGSVIDDSPSDGAAASDETLRAAVASAQSESGAASLDMEIDELNPPSSTLVAAVARANGRNVAVSVVWLGDSRAYWIDAGDARLLTVDHEVEGALTRWVGIDASNHVPQTVHHEFEVTDEADLVVCSDGMWRYFDPDLGQPAADLLARLKADDLTGLDLVRALVDYANEQGGHDNISVAHWAPDRTDDRADDDPSKESRIKEAL